jgi:hypothetical protein
MARKRREFGRLPHAFLFQNNGGKIARKGREFGRLLHAFLFQNNGGKMAKKLCKFGQVAARLPRFKTNGGKMARIWAGFCTLSYCKRRGGKMARIWAGCRTLFQNKWRENGTGLGRFPHAFLFQKQMAGKWRGFGPIAARFPISKTNGTVLGQLPHACLFQTKWRKNGAD